MYLLQFLFINITKVICKRIILNNGLEQYDGEINQGDIRTCPKVKKNSPNFVVNRSM